MPLSIFQPPAHQQFRQRVAQLSPSSTPLWGRMNAAQMLAHLNLAIGCAVQRCQLPNESNLLSRTVVKWGVLYLMPRFGRNFPTGKSITITDPHHFAAEQSAFIQILEQLPQQPANAFGSHPLFGKLSRREWGILAYKHIDHHLRQFGV